MTEPRTCPAGVADGEAAGLVSEQEPLIGGHRLCAGCPASVIARLVLNAAPCPVVAAVATGCLEVGTTIYPYTSWAVPLMHSAFENAAATIAGIEAMYRALRRQGRLERDLVFVAFGGDGGTYDIGLQALSGALERGHRFVYVCYDNGGYMNTGAQRSSATPPGAWTATTPVGRALVGKQGRRKDLTRIVADHHIPYVAQASPSHWEDFYAKAKRAFAAEGPAFLNVLCPCVPGWKFEPDLAISQGRLAVESCYWPLFEVVQGRYRLTYLPREKRPLEEWMRPQGRFRHLLKPAYKVEMARLQEEVDSQWESLLYLARTHGAEGERAESQGGGG